MHIGLTPNFCGIGGVYPSDPGASMINEKTRGDRIGLRIRVLDGTGTPLKDALIEIWQADANGFYSSPADMRGSAYPRFPAGAVGRPTWKPACAFSRRSSRTRALQRRAADGTAYQPVNRARGINIGLHTRLYFSDEEEPMPRTLSWRGSNIAFAWRR